MVRVARDGDDAHPCGDRRLDARRRVLDGDALLRRDAEPLRRGEEKVGRRLPLLHLVARHRHVEQLFQSRSAQGRLEPLAQRRRRDRDRHAALLELARRRDRVLEDLQIGIEQLEQSPRERGPERVGGGKRSALGEVRVHVGIRLPAGRDDVDVREVVVVPPQELPPRLERQPLGVDERAVAVEDDRLHGARTYLMPEPARVAANARSQSSSGTTSERSGSSATCPDSSSSIARSHDVGVDALPDVTVSSR